MTKAPAFEKETDLCAAFIESLPKEWAAYPETCGFDILLVRVADGFQIGVEAKLRLNAKVISQVAQSTEHYRVTHPGPDCRAVLVPFGVSMELATLLPLIHITAITMRFDRGVQTHYRAAAFHPALPGSRDDYRDNDWFELFPERRLTVPDYVPDVAAGSSAPLALTPWKVKAIKIVITLARRGFVTRSDFKHFSIDMTRWTQQGWLKKFETGWIAGEYLPDFRAQHPTNFPQIEADYEKWKAPEPAQQALL